MQLVKAGDDILFRCFYIDTKVGKDGLTVTVDVNGPDGTSLVTAQSATEVDATNLKGVYEYLLDGADTADAGRYTAVFKTVTSSVDQQHLSDEAEVLPALTQIDDIETDVTGIDTDLTALAAVVDTIDSATSMFAAIHQEKVIYTPVGAMTEVTLGAGVLSLTRPSLARAILVQVTGGQNVRWTLDGSTPTTTHGFVLYDGAASSMIQVNGSQSHMKFLRAASGAILAYQWVHLDN